jgi:hypothetical protein
MGPLIHPMDHRDPVLPGILPDSKLTRGLPWDPVPPPRLPPEWETLRDVSWCPLRSR